MSEERSKSDTAEIGRAISLARSLLKKGGALESTAAGEMIDRTRLTQALEEQIRLQMSHSAELPAVTAKAAAVEGLANAENALNKTAQGASPSELTELEVASLEAIIEVTGRPAMRYENGRVGMPPSALGENDRWRVLIATARNDINQASAAVGRIMIMGASGVPENIGTGWRLAQDLIVTNRHVGLLMVKKPDSNPPELTLDETKHPFIDFSATDNSAATKRFDIAAVVYCAAEKYVDLAILKVKSGLADIPAPLTLDWDTASLGSQSEQNNGAEPEFRGKEIYVVGHPFKQRRSPALASVFGAADGLKRWSPGLVKRIHTNEPILEHDCSTLGGNSGSCVLSAEGHTVVGVHMGGLEVDELTDRGLANVAVAFSHLGQHPVAEILRTGIV
jgi:hypothetical protein